MTVQSLLSEGKWREAIAAAQIPLGRQQDFLTYAGNFLRNEGIPFSLDQLSLTLESPHTFSLSAEHASIRVEIREGVPWSLMYSQHVRPRNCCAPSAEHSHAEYDDDDEYDDDCPACNDGVYCYNHERYSSNCGITVLTQLGESNIL